MSENNSSEVWLATDDPTDGELPVTEFIGTKKDLEQTLPPQEGDGSGLNPPPVGTPEDPKTPGGEAGETVDKEVPK